MDAKYFNLEPHRQEAIINAALKEFAAKGYDSASTNIMAREAGISKPLFFHYVNSKKELFLFLWEYCLQKIKTVSLGFMESIKAEKDLFSRIRRVARLKIEMAHRYPHVYGFYLAAALTDSQQVRPEPAPGIDEFFMTSLEKLYRDIDHSKFREGIDVARVLKLITWAMEGFVYDLHRKLNTGKALSNKELDFDRHVADFDGYLAILEKSFYK